MKGKPREAWWAGALGPGVDPSDDPGPAPWRDPEAEALAWWSILRQRVPRRDGEDEREWYRRAVEEVRRARIDPWRPGSGDPVYSPTVIPGLEVHRGGEPATPAPATPPRLRRRGGSGARRKGKT